MCWQVLANYLKHSKALTATKMTGWWLTYPSEKYESRLGLSIPICGKNVPNHQPDEAMTMWCFTQLMANSPIKKCHQRTMDLSVGWNGVPTFWDTLGIPRANMACWKTRPFFFAELPTNTSIYFGDFDGFPLPHFFLLPPRSPRQWEIAPLPHDQHPIWRGELGFASRWRTWGNSNHRRTQKAPKKMRETCVQLIQDLKGSGKTEDITLCFAKQKKSPPATSKWTCRIIWSVDNVGYSRCFLCCIHSASTRNHGPSLFDPKPKIETWKLFNVLYLSVFNYSGWWLTYPSEKYESQLGWFFPTEWKKQCSKKKFQTTNQYLLWKTFIKILWTPLWHMEMTW